MHILLHGGKCCGIKHIFELGYDPNCTLRPKAESTKDLMTEGNSFKRGGEDHNFFWPKAPKETYLERLDRYLTFLDEHRPRGVCEIVLNGNQLIPWREVLEERGFVQVNKCKNSNSHNTIYIFHRNKG